VIILGAAVGMLVAAMAIVGAYAVWLMTARRRSVHPQSSTERPSVLIVVATYDEAALIEKKLENLAALTYSDRRVVIVDGGSTDGTVACVERWIASHPDFTLLETQHRDKTAQLNHALAACNEDAWVLVTDADSLLEPDTLERLFAMIAADGSVGVVGTHVRPTSAHALETLHWRATDWLRGRESDRGSAAIVAAPCYLARREFLALPNDAIADDVHVACSAMLAGRRVAQSDVTVLELRSPRTLRALLRHKYRKGDAYLREILRFLPLAHRMPAPMRAIFLWRAALLTIVPLLATLGGAMLLIAIAWIAPLYAAALLLLILPPARGAALAVMLTVVSAAALLAYPFSRQAASFPKIVQLSDEPQ
jgi:cellulose synthase/poly-beta-1,6-N-acetylglucosamine synthase-like glycosyltransferase